MQTGVAVGKLCFRMPPGEQKTNILYCVLLAPGATVPYKLKLNGKQKELRATVPVKTVYQQQECR